MSGKNKKIRGWCNHCGVASYSAHREPNSQEKQEYRKCGIILKPSDRLCNECGEILKPLESITPEEKAMVDMQDWFAEVCRSGKNGPSPGGASAMLGCHRSMIDRLVEMGVLEKSEFSFKGQKLIIISQRSLEKAKENRKQTGNWTGHPVHRGA